MNTRVNSVYIIIVAVLAAFGSIGCHKQTVSTAVPQTLPDAMTQLQVALANSSAETQSNLGGVYLGIRYADYAKAGASLQQISSDPGLNDNQKKLVSEVDALLKKAAADQAAAPPPAQ